MSKQQQEQIPETARSGEKENTAENRAADGDKGLNGAAGGLESPENSGAGAESAQNRAEGTEAEPPEPAPEEKIAGLEAQLAETKDQLLRKAADFENFRKRMNQEKQNAIEFANKSLLEDLLPVIDDFERAIQSAETSKDFAGLLDGVAMIEKRLTSQLESKWGLKRFDSAGEPFDPNRHEALMMEKSPEVSEPVVQEDFIKGYTLKDRVIRAAKVKVFMPESPAGAVDSEASPVRAAENNRVV